MELLYDRLCENCNKAIGSKIETQFLRAGHIGFFRWLIGLKGKNGLPPCPFYTRVAGTDPLYMVGRAHECPYDLLWEVDAGSEDVYPLRQIVFEHPLAGFHPIPIWDKMRGHPQALLDYLSKKGLEKAKPVHAIATPDEIPWLEALIRALGHEPPGNWVTTEWTPQRIQLVVNLQVTDQYFRAIAKIAFHYTLKMFSELTGHESEFDEIKGFIWNGGEIAHFVPQMNSQFVSNFKRGLRPTRWMHILAVQRGGGAITGYAQFFAGPRSLPHPYRINIGRDPARIISRPKFTCHQYVILEASPTRVPRGVMEDSNPVNHVWIPSKF